MRRIVLSPTLGLVLLAVVFASHAGGGARATADTDANKAATARLFAAVNRGDTATLATLVSPAYVDHDLGPGAPTGLAALQQPLAVSAAAFPDARVTVEALIAEDDLVVARVTWRGTQRGEFLGIPPSGRAFAISAISIWRWADGRVVEHWGVFDG